MWSSPLPRLPNPPLLPTVITETTAMMTTKTMTIVKKIPSTLLTFLLLLLPPLQPLPSPPTQPLLPTRLLLPALAPTLLSRPPVTPSHPRLLMEALMFTPEDSKFTSCNYHPQFSDTPLSVPPGSHRTVLLALVVPCTLITTSSPPSTIVPTVTSALSPSTVANRSKFHGRESLSLLQPPMPARPVSMLHRSTSPRPPSWPLPLILVLENLLTVSTIIHDLFQFSKGWPLHLVTWEVV